MFRRKKSLRQFIEGYQPVSSDPALIECWEMFTSTIKYTEDDESLDETFQYLRDYDPSRRYGEVQYHEEGFIEIYDTTLHISDPWRHEAQCSVDDFRSELEVFLLAYRASF